MPVSNFPSKLLGHRDINDVLMGGKVFESKDF